MRKFSYTVIIRTLMGGGKYQRLLTSIDKQTIKPEHIYIIQPHGYEPPKEKLGYEEFLHTDKGMWNQRIYGMEYCCDQPDHSKYLLVCDDDVEFEPNFMSDLLVIAETYNIDTLVPIKDDFRPFAYKIILRFLGARTENKTSPYKIEIRKNARFSVNNNLHENVNPTQSGVFQCFLMRADITPLLKLREEMWLDDTRYAIPDDQVFFYKAFLSGLKTYACKKPEFKHLDGKSGETNIQRLKDSAYSMARNIRIFWYKFIKPYNKNISSKISAYLSFEYYLSVNKLMYFIMSIKNRDFSVYREYNRGLKDGKAYVEHEQL